ncbi:hypothetical protein, partial [Kribbia dieselivorans]|uniref:hypothetical protein n=1 Tax=Kribbia dieselivorans TaxID=331526 RepID=UPI001C3F2A3E
RRPRHRHVEGPGDPAAGDLGALARQRGLGTSRVTSAPNTLGSGRWMDWARRHEATVWRWTP